MHFDQLVTAKGYRGQGYVLWCAAFFAGVSCCTRHPPPQQRPQQRPVSGPHARRRRGEAEQKVASRPTSSSGSLLARAGSASVLLGSSMATAGHASPGFTELQRGQQPVTEGAQGAPSGKQRLRERLAEWQRSAGSPTGAEASAPSPAARGAAEALDMRPLSADGDASRPLTTTTVESGQEAPRATHGRRAGDTPARPPPDLSSVTSLDAQLRALEAQAAAIAADRCKLQGQLEAAEEARRQVLQQSREAGLRRAGLGRRSAGRRQPRRVTATPDPGRVSSSAGGGRPGRPGLPLGLLGGGGVGRRRGPASEGGAASPPRPTSPLLPPGRAASSSPTSASPVHRNPTLRRGGFAFTAAGATPALAQAEAALGAADATVPAPAPAAEMAPPPLPDPGRPPSAVVAGLTGAGVDGRPPSAATSTLSGSRAGGASIVARNKQLAGRGGARLTAEEEARLGAWLAGGEEAEAQEAAGAAAALADVDRRIAEAVQKPGGSGSTVGGAGSAMGGTLAAASTVTGAAGTVRPLKLLPFFITALASEESGSVAPPLPALPSIVEEGGVGGAAVSLGRPPSPSGGGGGLPRGADPVIAKQRRSRQARAALSAIDAALDTLRGADLVPGEGDGEGGGRDCAASVGGRTALSAASELRRITRADILIEAMRGADVLGGSDLAPATGMAQPAEVEALLAQLAQELTPEQAAAFQAGAEAIVREGAAGSGQGGGLRAERVPVVAAPRPPRSVSPLVPPSRLGEGGGAEEEEEEDTPPSPPSDPEAVAALAAALARRHEGFDAVAAGVAPPPTVGGAGQEGHEEGGPRPRDAVDELRAALAALKHRRLALRDMAAASDALSREVATALAAGPSEVEAGALAAEVEALGQRRGFEGGLGEEEGVPGAAAGAGAGGEAGAAAAESGGE